MTRLPISVCMISGAELHRIPRALASVSEWTSEIIVVLNAEVTDGTEEIARQYGAKVFREPWRGHIAQKNSAAAKAAQPWLFGLDADEEVSPALRAEIERLFASNAAGRNAAWSFPRCTLYLGRWIRHGDWYPDRKSRLWQRGWAHWAGHDPHDQLIVEGAVGRLSADLLHHTADSLDYQLRKTNAYADDFARQAQTAGRTVRMLDLAVRPAWRFFRAYVLRRGFLDGWQGYYIAVLTAFYTLLRYTKVKEAGLRRTD